VFSSIQNHVFLDGNKRIGHAALETFRMLNDYEIAAHVDEQERIVLDVASGSSGAPASTGGRRQQPRDSSFDRPRRVPRRRQR
jgi:prophage maintenance system killer protein